jgi:3-dehydroquinate synthetase
VKHFSYKPSDSLALGKEYLACFGNNKTELKEFLPNYINKYKSFVYIVDKNLPLHFLKDVAYMTGIKPDNVIYIDPSMKTIDRIITIWNAMVKLVPTAAISIGGGTTGDISGLACGTYQRGIPRFYFPTTVLSMVDASLGGKSGIDHVGVKNSIGVIHYPDVVISYTPLLKTLNKNEYHSGFGEIIKAAVLQDSSFFKQLENFSKNLEKYTYSDEETLDVFFKSSSIKAKICEESNNKKMKLLYGHAIGHAYEKLTTEHKRHGDCVAVGIVVEGALSVLLGLWNREQWIRLEKLVRKFNLPASLPQNIDLNALLEKMLHYKKLVDKENYFFCLPDRIGHVNNQDGSCLTSVRKTEMKGLLTKALSWIKDNSYVQH